MLDRVAFWKKRAGEVAIRGWRAARLLRKGALVGSVNELRTGVARTERSLNEEVGADRREGGRAWKTSSGAERWRRKGEEREGWREKGDERGGEEGGGEERGVG